MPKINVCVIRHGERIDHMDPFWEKDALVPYDPYLTERGKLQAYKTGTYIKQLLTEDTEVFVFSSPFLRCIQTSAGIKEGSSLKCLTKVEPHLCEWLTDEYYKEAVPQSIVKTNINIPQYKQGIDPKHTAIEDVLPDYPESYDALVRRAEKYCENLTLWALGKCKALNKPILIILVSHGATVGALVAALAKTKIIVGVNYCSVSLLEYDYSKRTWGLIGKYQDNAHLEEVGQIKT